MYLGLPSLGLRNSAVAFAVSQLFAKGEPGAHFEAYDPNKLLRRRNLLTYSEDFTNATWVKSQSSFVAGKLIENAATGFHTITQSIARVGVKTVATVRAKAGERTWIAVNLGGVATYFDLVNGVVGSGAISSTITPAADQSGYFDCIVRTDNPSSTTFTIVIATASSVSNYAGDGTSGVYLARTQLEEYVSDPNVYQRVTDWNTEYMAAALESIGMWQDVAGTTPVTAVEQPVGLWLDTKLGSVRGPELRGTGVTVLAGSATPATYDVTTGAGIIDRIDAPNQSYIRIPSVNATSFYEVILTSTGANGVSLRSGDLGAVLLTVAAGETRHTIVPAGLASLSVASAGGVAPFILQTIKLLPGNHAIQATSTSRPVLSARYNLLTKTEQLDDATWTKVNGGTGALPVVTSNYGIAPDGTQTATRITFNKGAGATLGDYSGWQQNLPVAAPARHLYVALKTADSSTKKIALRDNGFQLCDVTGDWQWFTYDEPAGSIGFQLILRGTYGTSDSVDLLVWHPDSRTADDAALNIPAYQRVNTPTDYDTEGFPHYLKFDGVDDSLQTGSIDFSGTDKMTVWAGVTKLSDAAAGLVAELGPGTFSPNVGAFFLIAPDTSGRHFSFGSAGSVFGARADAMAANWASPATAVLTGASHIAADAIVLRANGNQVAASASDQGSGNYGNYKLNIGRRDGASLPFNGRIYSLTPRGAASSDGEIRRMERYVANRMEKVLA